MARSRVIVEEEVYIELRLLAVYVCEFYVPLFKRSPASIFNGHSYVLQC
jgi:hypothetical protein